MLQRTFLLIGLLIIAGCTIGKPSQPKPRDTSTVGEAEIRLMIERFGPVIHLRNDEKYLMDDPEYVLDHGASLAWGKVTGDDYKSFRCEVKESRPTSAATLIDDARKAGAAIQALPDATDFRYWIKINDGATGGNMNRAQALVRAIPFDKHSTEIQFWLFYPFNGPGRVKISAASTISDDTWLKQAGRHYGDWENVSIVVSNTATELRSVYMSRHRKGETFHLSDDGTYRSVARPGTKLEIAGTEFLGNIYEAHPVVYSAISSHAHYPSAGNHIYERVFSFKWRTGLIIHGTAAVDLFDRTEAGRTFRTWDDGNYRIVSSDMPGYRVTEPDWLTFDGRWGQPERLRDKIEFGIEIPFHVYDEVGSGPTGPVMKPKWRSTFR